MTDLAVTAGASWVAHGVHYTVLGVGLLDLVAMLAPGRAPAQDDHAVRVRALRESVAAGTLTSGGAAPRHLPAPAPRAEASRLWLPLAVVSCTAAAGVHAAVGPAHFREKTVLGLFFAVATTAQIVWALLVVARPARRLLVAGVLGTVGLAVLWAVTRTVGLPGLLPGPEAVGPWDLACVTWEVVAVVACLPLLGNPHGCPQRVAAWSEWAHRARLWALVSVVGLGLLSIAGGGS